MPGDGGATGRAMWVCAVLAAFPFLAAAAEAEAAGRYRAVFNFGDSLVDAGNLVTEGIPDYLATARLPYGQTYFGYPTGRCSDGLLVVDFIGKFRQFLASLTFRVRAFLGGASVRNSMGFGPLLLQRKSSASRCCRRPRPRTPASRTAPTSPSPAPPRSTRPTSRPRGSVPSSGTPERS